MKRFGSMILILGFTLINTVFASTVEVLPSDDISTGTSIQQPNPDIQDNNQPVGIECVPDKYEIVGPVHVKKGDSVEYVVKVKDEIGYTPPKTTNINISTNGERIEIFTGSQIAYKFENTGSYDIQAIINETAGCRYILTQDINVYDEIFLYIGNSLQEFELDFDQNFGNQNTYFKKIILTEQNYFSEQEFLQKFIQDIYYIKNAENIVIYTNKFTMVFESLGKIRNSHNIDLTSKQLFLVSDVNNNFLKRILANYIKVMGISKIYVLGESDFLNYLSKVSFGESATSLKYVQEFSLSLGTSYKYYVLSNIIDNLIYNGFPSSLLALILAVSAAVLIISVFRQIIGFSVFSVYNPLMFAISMVVLGIKFSFILLFITFIATYLTRMFTKKIYLLYSAKISMLIILYFIVIIMTLWADRFFGLNFIDYSIFSNSLILFPIIFLVIIANKVFYEGFSIFSKGWRVSFFEFLIVSFVVYFVLTWTSFQYLLLSYPELILVILLLNIIVGRFTGLQLLEYFRFMPLIRRTHEEEE